jgi:hypothetical protein
MPDPLYVVAWSVVCAAGPQNDARMNHDSNFRVVTGANGVRTRIENLNAGRMDAVILVELNLLFECQ